MINIIHLGDINKINGHNVPLVDVVTGGSPCQDLSVAGKRAGLAGERSGLFMEQIRIVKEMRDESKSQLSEGKVDHIMPRYMVWENVCFVFDTLIETSTGLKKIGEIQVGDLVRTHLGRYMKVVNTYVHSDKEVVRVNIADNSELICTPNHPIYAHHRVSDNMYDNWEFIPAGLLTSEYVVASFDNDGSIMPKSVISVEALSKKEIVYNLSVLEDNTYVANGIICHNCGAFSSNNGEDFRAVLEETARVVDADAVIPRPPEGQWTDSGAILLRNGGTLAYRVHDAQYWGVPQRRRRICLLADFDGDTAPKILFELRGETDGSKSDETLTDTGAES